MIIAIDGPAASGKGTLARRLARHFGLPHLDTGLLYRATAQAMRDRGLDAHDVSAAVAAARAITADDLSNPRLRDQDLGERASIVAAFAPVRAALIDYQRTFAATPGGAVLDGRDIDTVICPDATVKLFITASADVRAHRRWLELSASGAAVTRDDVLADIRARDQRDSARADAPLRPAETAHLLDTSLLDIETAFKAALEIIAREQPVGGGAL